MAVMTIHNYCDHIQMAGRLYVAAPDLWLRGDTERLPVLYLLAPEGEDGSRWLRHTQVELLAEQHNMIMVMVPCLQGCYTDMAYGYRFFQSLVVGVPAYLKRNLPAIRVDEGPCFVAGCSMGGMGAIKLALSYPASFAAVGSFSGRLDNEDSFRHPAAGDWLTEKRMKNLWGSPEAIPNSSSDLHALVDTAIARGIHLPPMYLSVGTGDAGYASSSAFAGKVGLDIHYVQHEGPQGWRSWANELEHFLTWRAGKEANKPCR